MATVVNARSNPFAFGLTVCGDLRKVLFMNSPVFWVAFGLFFGVLFSFQNSRPLVKSIAFTSVVVLIGFLVYVDQRGPVETKATDWGLEWGGASEWRNATEEERMKLCEKFSAERIAGSRTDFTAEEYLKAVDRYYNTDGDQHKSVRWIASTSSYSIENKIRANK